MGSASELIVHMVDRGGLEPLLLSVMSRGHEPVMLSVRIAFTKGLNNLPHSSVVQSSIGLLLVCCFVCTTAAAESDSSNSLHHSKFYSHSLAISVSCTLAESLHALAFIGV